MRGRRILVRERTGNPPIEVRVASADPEHGNANISPRQVEVLSLVAAGLTTKEVARVLGVSPHTIRSHLNSLFRKLGIHTQAGVVAAWLRRPSHE